MEEEKFSEELNEGSINEEATKQLQDSLAELQDAEPNVQWVESGDESPLTPEEELVEPVVEKAPQSSSTRLESQYSEDATRWHEHVTEKDIFVKTREVDNFTGVATDWIVNRLK